MYCNDLLDNCMVSMRNMTVCQEKQNRTYSSFLLWKEVEETVKISILSLKLRKKKHFKAAIIPYILNIVKLVSKNVFFFRTNICKSQNG